jgi:hypothetical protein
MAGGTAETKAAKFSRLASARVTRALKASQHSKLCFSVSLFATPEHFMRLIAAKGAMAALPLQQCVSRAVS